MQGSIPPAMSLLTNAATIDLSGSLLTGPLPASLAALSPAAALNLKDSPRLCGGAPRTLLDGLSLETEGTGLERPCFQGWIEIRMSGAEPVAVGPGLQVGLGWEGLGAGESLLSWEGLLPVLALFGLWGSSLAGPRLELQPCIACTAMLPSRLLARLPAEGQLSVQGLRVGGWVATIIGQLASCSIVP
jgi:hypothetical protein